MGKKSHLAQTYFKNKTPTRFLAEEIILQICKSIDAEIDIEKEKEFVMHLKKEIARIKRMTKAVPKSDKQGKCVNSDCKYHNSLDIKNTDKYGQCRNCEGFEHFNCANIDEKRKLVYQSGEQNYLCTECLLNFPMLALQVTSPCESSEDGQLIAVDVGMVQDPTETRIDMIHATMTPVPESSGECDVEAGREPELEKHKEVFVPGI